MLNLIPYCIILRFGQLSVLFLDIHMQICVALNTDLICGPVLIFLCGLLSVSDDNDYL